MSDADVIVLDIDGGEMLVECVEAIRRQSVAPASILVFDNGSRIPLVERLSGSLMPVIVLRSETNVGFAGGVNRALRQATSEYVALVNNDALVDPDWLATLLGAMRGDERLAAVQTVIRRDASTIDGGGIDVSDGTIRQIGSGVRAGTPLAAAWGVSATAALYRRAAIGDRMFDERFFAYYEDVELCARLHASGWRTAVLPVIKATHRGSHSASVLGPAEAKRLRTRNRYFVARLHPGTARVGALLREDAKLMLQRRSSLRGILEGLLTRLDG
jgi:GT2 family glycosyltransferase